MRLRSTGLGKQELEAELVDIRKVDDLVVFKVDVVKPVRWHTRMGFQEKDIRALVLATLKPQNLLFILKALLFSSKNRSGKGDF